MEQKIRILQVLTIMGRGGAETMVMNYYRALDKSKYQFDFLVHRQERGAYDDEIEQLGGHIYRACSIRPWHYWKYFQFLDSFFEEHGSEYKAVHAHIQENSGFVLKYAAKYGIEKRLCTSHIADLGIDYKYPFRLFAKIVGNRYTSIKLACGIEAGYYLYGKNKDFQVFHNAICASDFAYDDLKYKKFRSQKGWSDLIVIGNVSRFGYQKNHVFLVDIFQAFHSVNPNSILVLIGDGELRTSIEEKVKRLKLEKYVFFEGVQSNIAEYLQCFDVILFPSLFEGLPVSIIEAQAAGLRCFLSDTIDHTTDVTGDVTFISLNKSPKEWAQIIYSSLPYQRPNNLHKIQCAGYDVAENMEKLLNLYLY